MVTIAISEKVRRRLLIIAADLQKALGKKINFNEVLEYLTKKYEENNKNPMLFEKFCEPINPNIGFNEVYRELLKGRKEDERNLTF